MTADFLMLAIYLLVHFIVISLAVLIGLWLYAITEWVLNKWGNSPLDQTRPIGRLPNQLPNRHSD